MHVIKALPRPLAMLLAFGTSESVAQTVPPVVHATQTEATPVAPPTPLSPQPSWPGPPPPQVDCTTRPFIVFFPSNSADVTPDAAEILDDVATWSCGPGKAQFPVSIAGFADRAGQASDNLALSQRRAEAVKAYLVRHGLRAKLVGTLALGEAPVHLRIKTPDGVSESQNRRVEITFRADIDP